MTTPRYSLSKRLIEAFWAKVNKRPDRGPAQPDCWQWRGCLHTNGYGRFPIRGNDSKTTNALAHRLSWELANGSLPEGYVLTNRKDKCNNRGCVTPEHWQAQERGEAARQRRVKQDIDVHEEFVDSVLHRQMQEVAGVWRKEREVQEEARQEELVTTLKAILETLKQQGVGQVDEAERIAAALSSIVLRLNLLGAFLSPPLPTSAETLVDAFEGASGRLRHVVGQPGGLHPGDVQTLVECFRGLHARSPTQTPQQTLSGLVALVQERGAFTPASLAEALLVNVHSIPTENRPSKDPR